MLLVLLLLECVLCGEPLRGGARYCTDCGAPAPGAEIEIDQAPRDARAWFVRGRARAVKGDAAGAIADLDRAIEIDPFRVEVRLARGRARLISCAAEADARAAIEDFAQALRIDPKSAGARAGRAEALVRLADLRPEERDPFLRAAALYLEEAAAIEPAKARIWRRLGEVRLQAGDAAGAVEALDRAVEIGPDAASRVARARAKAALKKLAEAHDDATEAVRLRPDLFDAWLARGDVRVLLARGAEAVGDYSEALRLRPDHVAAWIRRGGARMLLGTDEARFDAVADFTRALELRPNDAEALAARGGAFFALRRYDAAAADWTRAIELRPDWRARLAPMIEEARRKEK